MHQFDLLFAGLNLRLNGSMVGRCRQSGSRDELTTNRRSFTNHEAISTIVPWNTLDGYKLRTPLKELIGFPLKIFTLP